LYAPLAVLSSQKHFGRAGIFSAFAQNSFGAFRVFRFSGFPFLIRRFSAFSVFPRFVLRFAGGGALKNNFQTHKTQTAF
jgi:hypothetical protein